LSQLHYNYIADSMNNRIVRWASNSITGVCIAGCTGKSGAQPNRMNFAIGLTFDSNGSLYVSDAWNLLQAQLESVI